MYSIYNQIYKEDIEMYKKNDHMYKKIYKNNSFDTQFLMIYLQFLVTYVQSDIQWGVPLYWSPDAITLGEDCQKP